MCISLFAPNETQQKKTNAVTGVPSEKTNKEISFNLTPYIMGGGGENDDLSEVSHPLLVDKVDAINEYLCLHLHPRSLGNI